MIYNFFKKNKERRRYARCKVNLPIKVCYFGQVSTDSAKDIGEGGLLLCSQNNYNVGGKVHVSFEGTGISPVIAQAEIIYKTTNHENESFFGLRFVDVPQSLRSDIQRMV